MGQPEMNLDTSIVWKSGETAIKALPTVIMAARISIIRLSGIFRIRSSREHLQIHRKHMLKSVGGGWNAYLYIAGDITEDSHHGEFRNAESKGSDGKRQ